MIFVFVNAMPTGNGGIMSLPMWSAPIEKSENTTYECRTRTPTMLSIGKDEIATGSTAASSCGLPSRHGKEEVP
jgi:hypothetical protein